MRTALLCLAAVVFVAAASFAAWPGLLFPAARPAPQQTVAEPPAAEPAPEGLQRATFGGGCFWCTEAVFSQLRGVLSVTPGYSGGTVANPTYEQVCGKKTGHAEVVQVVYNPAEITYSQLLDVFFATHDPTTPNRQGHDKGPQYRSVVFYHTPEQRTLAEKAVAQLQLSIPVVTEIAPFTVFYRAEDYHQNYYKNNPTNFYCAANIGPKLAKLRKLFKDQLKPAAAGR